jgi:hypothetical protein
VYLAEKEGLRMKFSALWLCLLAGLAACSSKSKEPDPFATVSEFCEAWGKAACSPTTVAACSGMATSDDLTDATKSCITSQQAFCEGLVPDGYVSTQAAVCLNAVQQAYSDGTLTATEAATVLHLGDPCNHLITGPSAAGESCTQDNDCDTVNDYLCVMKSGVGACAIPVVVDNGTSCKAAEATCNTGFYCDGKNCVESDAMGDSCAHDYECGMGLVCDSDKTSSTVGTCITPVDQTMCKEDSDCTKNKICHIASGLDTGRCGASITLASTDQLCESLR